MTGLQSISALISQFGYVFLLPAAIIEGPIVTVIGAFLASIGILNVYWVYVIAVIGDVIGDTIYYWVGRAGRKTIVPKYGKYVGITEERIAYAEAHYQKHLWKTMIFGKVTQAPILIIIVLAGIVRENFLKFLGVIFLITLPKALIFLLVGYYFGKSYVIIGHYINNSLVVISIGIAVIVGIIFVIRTLKKKGVIV